MSPRWRHHVSTFVLNPRTFNLLSQKGERNPSNIHISELKSENFDFPKFWTWQRKSSPVAVHHQGCLQGRESAAPTSSHRTGSALWSVTGQNTQGCHEEAGRVHFEWFKTPVKTIQSINGNALKVTLCSDVFNPWSYRMFTYSSSHLLRYYTSVSEQMFNSVWVKSVRSGEKKRP